MEAAPFDIGVGPELGSHMLPYYILTVFCTSHCLHIKESSGFKRSGGGYDGRISLRHDCF